MPDMPRNKTPDAKPSRFLGVEFGRFPYQPAVSAVLIAAASVSACTMSFSESGIGVKAAEAAEAQDIAREVLAQDKAKESPEAKELREKVNTLVKNEFGGDYSKAFKHFAGSDDKLNRDEVVSLLKKAGVGNAFTRGAWADGVMQKFDADKSGGISWTEFIAVCPVN